MSRFFLYLALLLSFCFSATSAHATTSAWQDGGQAKLRMLIGGVEKESNRLRLGLEMDLKDGWRTYWRSSGESGRPLMLDWSDSTNIENIEIIWPIPTRKVFSQAGYLETYTYQDKVILPLEVTLKDPAKETSVELMASYVVCDESCMMKQAFFMMDIPPNYVDEAVIDSIDQVHQSVPKRNGTSGFDIIRDAHVSMAGVTPRLIVKAHSAQKDWGEADLFIDQIDDVYFRKPDMVIEQHDPRTMVFHVPIITTLDDDQQLLSRLQQSPLRTTLVYDELRGVESYIHAHVAETIPQEILSVSQEAAVEIPPHTLPENVVETAPQESQLVSRPSESSAMSPYEDTETSEGIEWLILLMAFFGGALLNVMPCVLPIISMKLFGLLQKASADLSTIRVSCFATTLGILSSYVALAAITVAIQDIGGLVGLGFHFQEPGFVIFSIVVLMLFAYNLWGYYEISIPSLISHLTTSRALQTHAAHGAHFFNGAFATLLATPCSAPLLGTAVSFALTHNTADIFLIFALMGLGMASPYMIFMLKPQCIKALPKPGPWMLLVKAGLGILLTMTAMWLLWILSSQLGIQAAAALFLSLILMKFVLQYRGNVSWLDKRRGAWVAFLLVVSFVVPYQAYEYKLDEEEAIDHLWQPFIERDIAELVSEGKTVFVDVTADWCVTCKMNKFRVLDTRAVMRALNDDDVVAMRADITKSKPEINSYLKKYKRFGIPFNIVYGPKSPDGLLLPEWLSKEIVFDTLRQAR